MIAILTACEGRSPPSQAKTGSCSAAPIVVKGLCLGMTQQEATAKLTQQLPHIVLEPMGANELPAGQSGLRDIRVAINLKFHQGRLVGMFFGSPDLFGASDLSQVEFAEMFADSYDIPEWVETNQPYSVTWSHRYVDEGVLVEVFAPGDKNVGVSISQVATTGERAFN